MPPGSFHDKGGRSSPPIHHLRRTADAKGNHTLTTNDGMISYHDTGG
jgi:hypothetical protein